MKRRDRTTGLALLSLVLLAAPPGHAQEAALALETKIALGAVNGRIDHMAVDVARARILVAELGNDSLGVVDARQGKLLKTVTGLAEPQGVGYLAATDTVYVANARDGSVRLFKGEDLAPDGRIELGDDADNVRIDGKAGRVVVGYGRGALADIDPVRRAKVGEVALAAHPEGFQLDPGSGRAYVNLPDARQIAVVDRNAGKPVAAWPTAELRANFPMALADGGRLVVVVFRRPAKLAAYAAADGKLMAAIDVCGDVDDVFEDAKRGLLYVSCGEGFVDVLKRVAQGYRRVQRLATSPGARTALFVPELDRLYLAVRATASEKPALWVLRPAP